MVENGEKQGKQLGTFSTVIKACVPALILLVLWQLAFMSGKWSAYVLPGPEKVWKSFLSMAGNGILFKHILVSFKRVFIGFSISFVCAFSLGPVCGVYAKCASHQSDRPSHPLVWHWGDFKGDHYRPCFLLSNVYEYPKGAAFL